MENSLALAPPETAGPGQVVVRRGMWEERIRVHVRGFVARLLSGEPFVEKRRGGRRPFPLLLRLTPVEAQSLSPLGDPIVVVGKNLSDNGLGFFHPDPFPYRRAIVTLEDSAGAALSLLMEISWCRFTQLGWYDSGGRFLRIIDMPGA